MKVLFVCSMNQWHSPTAEAIYRNHAGLQVRSGGTSPKARRKVSAKDLQWADLILVMERKHKERLSQRFPAKSLSRKIEVLDIEDRYQAMDPRLIAELHEAVDPLIDSPR